MTRLVATISAFAVAAAHETLWACSVCGPQYNQKQAWAYLTMSFVFTAGPVLFIGGLVFYLRRRARRNQEQAD